MGNLSYPSGTSQVTSPLVIVLFGAQGSGKGTQARLLQQRNGIPQVSTGDLFRYNLKHKTDLGLLAKSYIDRGNLVPDSVTNAMVAERLAEGDAQTGAILDGYPRNIAQANALDKMLAEKGSAVSQAIYIDVKTDELMRRLTGRRVCRSCQATYHVILNPPSVESVCDNCAGVLYQRDDDKDKETIQRRLQVYFEETMPVINWYRSRGLLSEVAGNQPIQTVHESIIEKVESAKTSGNA